MSSFFASVFKCQEDGVFLPMGLPMACPDSVLRQKAKFEPLDPENQPESYISAPRAYYLLCGPKGSQEDKTI